MAEIICKRCNKKAEPLAEPPLKSKIGLEVQNHTCPTCWQQWQAQETMVINEYRLKLFDRGDRAKLDEFCRQFLGLAEGDGASVDFSAPE